MRRLARRLIPRLLDVREAELLPLFWSCAYYFLILTAYYVLRPVRDDMGLSGGVENLAWLFTGTLAGTLLLHPLYTALVARFPRRRFIALAYRFFILNLLAFFLVLQVANPIQSVWIGRVFFVWLSVFNLFVVSVFWSFMTDLYHPAQSKRLFGAIAVGGTLGALLGAGLAGGLVGLVEPVNLLLVSALILELAVRAARALDGAEGRLLRVASDESVGEADVELIGARGDQSSRPIGGGVLDGIRHVVRSPYLLGIAVLMLFFTIASTFLYFQRIDIVSRVLADDRDARIQLFAGFDLAANMLTLLTQIFLTGRLLRWFGVAFGLAFLPLISMFGFGLLAVAPVLAVVVVFEVLRRAGNFALTRPAREVLYTVLSRSDKYKAKNFNDTFVYRLGDQLGSWSYTVMAWFGLGLSGLAFSMMPLSAIWLLLAIWLGRRYARMQREQGSATPGATLSGIRQ